MDKYIDEIYQSLFSDVENIIRSNRGKTTDDIKTLKSVFYFALN